MSACGSRHSRYDPRMDMFEQRYRQRISDIGIEAAAAAGMKAFRHVRIDEASSRRAGNAVLFDDMLQLPQLLAGFANNTPPII